ncbi:SOS response-associated peptidase [Gleimia hominis]|uniref:Abasic site processing protein n=1 Tax=Gleimia hominis TaxID=595468 RepID=A0ABU3I910_9ACTO|nr:SOS response-associated peptidase [Gleimia hominis]MDT3766857.1 SOS response-associated peptidase [Gleimia hominis]
MCGRYALWDEEENLVPLFNVDRVFAPVQPTWNAAPSQLLPVVFERLIEPEASNPHSGEPDVQVRVAASKPGLSGSKSQVGPEASKPRSDAAKTQPDGFVERRLQPLQWGLVPSWARDARRPMINARSETALQKPSFKASMRRQRCLVPANGYFEWQTTPEGKQPFFLTKPPAGPNPTDPHADPDVCAQTGRAPQAAEASAANPAEVAASDPVMGFAGIYDAWQGPDGWLRTFAILTRAAPDALGHIHDRSPVVVPPDLWDEWLCPTIDTDAEVAALLDAIPAPNLMPRAVSKAVGNVANNNPSLVQSLD